MPTQSDRFLGVRAVHLVIAGIVAGGAANLAMDSADDGIRVAGAVTSLALTAGLLGAIAARRRLFKPRRSRTASEA
ncbi:hypothetical protein OJF2_00890 [Aquisphaera giovannonii]|uniref:Uncharacterized protein n=2 Tax=Aquisphaera giovannonii TaxID=406548 RepID=A0A5B9VU16_9BACT|nr:hypothetical protein OJF2_00890 [Aquisphaera giovannonii]